MKRSRAESPDDEAGESLARPRVGSVAENASAGAFVEAARARLVGERQAELQDITGCHDSLLRELFHMEKFVSMLVFDPEVAKTDNSPVFEAWRAMHDLLQTTTPSAGPSRTTRRGHNARLQSLQGSSSVNASGMSSTVAGPSTIAPQSIHDDDNIEIWSLLAKRKGKGKISATAESEKATLAQHESVSAIQQSRSVGRPPKKRLDGTSNESSTSRSRTIRVDVGRSVRRPFREVTPPSKTTSLHPRKRRKNVAALSTHTSTDHSSPSDIPLSGVKRVKLIVRRPPPRISHPWQKPRVKAYDGNLSAFLLSYTLLDNEDTSEAELERAAIVDARLRERIGVLRREGRLVERPTDWTSDDEEPPDPYDREDVWSAIIRESAVAVKSGFTSTSRHNAARVAAKIEAYWEGVASKEAKERAAEEKQLRQLAKATVKLVVGEWKKVVFHIREQERIRDEEEERQRNREHLDAILTQSGQILRAQHHDLSKISARTLRSRSASMLVDDADDSSEDEPDDSDEDSEDSDEETEHAEEHVTLPQRILSESLAETPEPSDIMEYSQLDHGSPQEPQFPPIPSVNDAADGLVLEPDPPALSSSSSATSHLSPRDDMGAPPSPRSPSGGIDDVSMPVVRSASEIVDDLESTSALLPLLNAKLDVQDVSDRPIGSPVDDASSAHEEVEDHMNTAVGQESTAAEELEASTIPHYLKPYAVAPVVWNPEARVTKPLLLRGVLRPYQQEGLEWLASLNSQHLNGILADEMGLGKTIQTIALLAHLACDRGIWGPHLIVVPTSVLLNWSMEFKKFLPGFKVLSYHGNAKQRQELRKGWNDKYSFNVCVTSYTLASKDAHIFRRKPWYYMILDEAHMIKNFRSQRWNTLLAFRSFRRLLLTGTPVQNNLTELWALLQFLLYGTDFAGHQQFASWFSDPLEKAIEAGETGSAEVQARAAKLHELLQPYILRRMKSAVEKQLPNKYEHIVRCPLAKRQRLLYDEFMARRTTRSDLGSGAYHRIANVLMQLRKVCNHPDLFEVRPIATPFAMPQAATTDYEIKELLVRRRFLQSEDGAKHVNLDMFGLRFIENIGESEICALETRRLDATSLLPHVNDQLEPAPSQDLRTIAGHKQWIAYQQRAATLARWAHIGYLNSLRCSHVPILGRGTLAAARAFGPPLLLPLNALDLRFSALSTCTRLHSLVLSIPERAAQLADTIERFACVPPAAVAPDVTRLTLPPHCETLLTTSRNADPSFGTELHVSATRLALAFPDASLLQHDCGKLQALADLLKERKRGGHRALIFTQMTRILDILERFLSLHGWLYLRLDGATKIEDRQYLTERFNADPRVFCFISSSRSGGVGINLTGADTVIFYDSDFNPQMDRQCEDRAHRIGQVRDVHIYRFCAAYTVEEALLAKAGQKRALDELVIQQGSFDWRALFDAATGGDGEPDSGTQGRGKKGEALVKAMAEMEDGEDRWAATLAEKEVQEAEGVDVEEFGTPVMEGGSADASNTPAEGVEEVTPAIEEGEDEQEEEGGTVVEYMLKFVTEDADFFDDWRV